MSNRKRRLIWSVDI